MLGDGARSLGNAALKVVRDRRSKDAHVVDARVGIKPIVFGGNDSIHERLRETLVVHWLSILDKNLPEFPALAVVEHGGGFHFCDLLEIELLRAVFVLAR